MQRCGEPLADDRMTGPNQPSPVSLGRAWIIATFRHGTGDETGDPLLHAHNVVPAITDQRWHALQSGTTAEPG